MKKKVFLMVFVILLVLGFSGCDNGNNDPKIYNVSIGTLINGSIIANPISGIEGTEILLTVNPKNWYRLKPNTLKYGIVDIDETNKTFNLPASDVVINAVFESVLTGSWGLGSSLSDIVYIFNENEFFDKQNGFYTQKGTWIIEDPNILILTYTHGLPSGSGGVETIEELIESNIGDFSSEIDFLTNSSFSWYGSIYYLIQ